MNDDLPDRLRVSAEEYEPDRDRMWARVSEGMREPRGVQAEPVRTGWRVPHLVVATGAAVVLIAGVVLFGQTIGLGPVVGPTPEPPAGGPATSAAEESAPPATSDAPEPDPETSTGEAPETTGDEEAETTGETEADEAGTPAWLWTDGAVDPGSNDYWSQANLTLRNDEALTELNVELRVALGEGLQSTGAWTTDSGIADAVVTEEDGFLVYRWTLREGAVLAAGEYTLAAQFNHGSGPRGAEDDDYTFEVATESGEDGRAEGDFS